MAHCNRRIQKPVNENAAVVNSSNYKARSEYVSKDGQNEKYIENQSAPNVFITWFAENVINSLYFID